MFFEVYFNCIENNLKSLKQDKKMSVLVVYKYGSF